MRASLSFMPSKERRPVGQDEEGPGIKALNWEFFDGEIGGD